MLPSDVLGLLQTVFPHQEVPFEAAAPDEMGKYVFSALIDDSGHSQIVIRRETKQPHGQEGVDICRAKFNEEGELLMAFTPAADSTGIDGLCDWLEESLGAFDWETLVDG